MSSPIYNDWAATQLPRETRPARRGRPVLALAGIIALLAAAIAFWQEIEPLVTFRSVTATIVSAELVRADVGRSPAASRSLAARRSRVGFVAAVNYRYTVDGLECFGACERRATLLEPGHGHGVPPAGAARLPGQVVTAWYNPWQPEDAVLDRTPNRAGLAIFAIIALCGALLVAAGGPPRAGDSRSTAIELAAAQRKSA